MIMSETKDKFEPQHTFVVYYAYTRSRARAIFSDTPIVVKGQVYVQWILPTVNYACETLRNNKPLSSELYRECVRESC